MTGIVAEVYDPALGSVRKLMVYTKGGQLLVRPWNRAWDPEPATPRLAEARLAMAEAAREARGVDGFEGELPRSSVVVGEGIRERMQRATSPLVDPRRDRAEYLASLLGPDYLEAAAKQLGVKRERTGGALDLARVEGVPGVFHRTRVIDGRPVAEILATRPGLRSRRP